MIQSDLLNDLYERSSLLQGLLREIMEQELNAETFEQLVRLQSEEGGQGHPIAPVPTADTNDKEDEDGLLRRRGRRRVIFQMTF